MQDGRPGLVSNLTIFLSSPGRWHGPCNVDWLMLSCMIICLGLKFVYHSDELANGGPAGFQHRRAV